MDRPQDRIVSLQRQLRIAREALTRIVSGSRDPEAIAGKALDEIWPLDRKQPHPIVAGHKR